MITFNIDGQGVNPDKLSEALMQAATEKVKDRLHERIASIRHPKTGEFPSVRVTGGTLETISVLVEGSAELLALVRERMASEGIFRMTFNETATKLAPKAFLSFAWENHALAERIATSLQQNGIETWWAEWEIRAGDSLRQKIDDGLKQCTHFIVLLTPESIGKPWVNQEMDAGLVRKIENESRFIAVRNGLPASSLPPLLSGMLSPTLDDFESGMLQLVHDIHGISKKPALGPAPQITTLPESGYSAAATAVAKFFVEETEHALHFDPRVTASQLAERVGLSVEDTEDALHELGELVDGDGYGVQAETELFVVFDKYFREWNPQADALRIAADLVNVDGFTRDPGGIAEQYGWPPRRLNPAISYLLNRRLIHGLTSMDSAPYVVAHLEKNEATRRFVKSR